MKKMSGETLIVNETLKALKPIIIEYLEGKPITMRTLTMCVTSYTQPHLGDTAYRWYKYIIEESHRYFKVRPVYYVNLDTELDFTLEAILSI
jgi:hypothetical protein